MNIISSHFVFLGGTVELDLAMVRRSQAGPQVLSYTILHDILISFTDSISDIDSIGGILGYSADYIACQENFLIL